jgi:AcrR family transcriptional regulator
VTAEQIKGTAMSKKRVSSRNKRPAIMRSAVEHFGTQGYDDTKWADIAKEVGIGATALYHYFESKQHCLFEIMAEALAQHQSEFIEATKSAPDYASGLTAALRSGFELNEHEVLRMRVLVDKQGTVGVKRSTPREENARMLARQRTRDLEFEWATYLVRGMELGLVPEADPRMLTRAVLALNKSVWEWYRPGGLMALSEIADFHVEKQLAVIGLRKSPPTRDAVRDRSTRERVR